MRLNAVLLLLIAFLFIGISINVPSDNDLDIITQDKLNEFESEIITENNNYESGIEEIYPQTINNIGIEVEGIIDKGFNYVFKVIKEFINEK